jgi:NADH-quinone oxidoreductase subunit L
MTSEAIIQHLLYLLFTPLLCALFIGCFFRKDGKVSLTLCLSAGLVIALCTLSLLKSWDGTSLQAYVEWFELGPLRLHFGFLLDRLSLLMLVVVSLIGLLVQVFSVGYMKEDTAKGRYFGGLCMFMFSMLGIVLADNLILLFIFWEWVGFSSYMLIAHYYETPFAKMASKKAFITNRVGDFCFLLGIIASYWHFGSFDIGDLEILNLGQAEASGSIHLIGFLLIGGFLGKSAQFPLHVWLPDAMAGPTPVSALMHAATMVAAGVFLLARLYFLLSSPVLDLILWICTGMALFGALCALAQSDIKKILAYSTLSQLAYMGVAIALHSPGLSLFHLATHAAFKAGLFLCAGAIIHALHHEQDIFKMGGLLKKMPFVSVVFIACMLSLCGVLGTAGFFSKDAILELSYLQCRPVYCVLAFTAFLTALYMGRLFWIGFMGSFRGSKSIHPLSLWMGLPLGILAILSIVAGYEQLWPHSLRSIFEADLGLIHTSIHKLGLKYPFIALHNALSLLGFGLAFFIYRHKSAKAPKAFYEGSIYQALARGLGIDGVYSRYIAIQQDAAKCLYFLDLALIGGLMMRGTAGIFAICSLFLKRMHTGSLQLYLYHFLGGFLLIVFFIFKALNVCVCH